MALNKIHLAYANSLVEVAQEQDKLAELESVFKDFVLLVESNEEIKDFFSQPFLNKKQLEQQNEIINFMNSELKWPPFFYNFVRVMVENGRLSYWAGIYEKFQQHLDKINGYRSLHITTCTPIEKELEDNIVKKLQDQLKCKIKLIKETDSSILGGVIFKTDDYILDGSIKNRLLKMQKNLLEGA